MMNILTSAVLIAFLAVSLSACGKRSAPKLPQTTTAEDPANTPDTSEKPDRPFILDGLL